MAILPQSQRDAGMNTFRIRELARSACSQHKLVFISGLGGQSTNFAMSNTESVPNQ